MKGILIAIEGIDGAGKSTQVRLLREALERAGEAVVASREPTSGPWGQLIRRSARLGRLAPAEELEAFIKDRAEHVANLIAPSLEAGRIVILDRYFYSSVAYQGARGARAEEVRTLMETRFPIPDAVFILDLEPQEGVRRIEHSRGDRPNRFEDPGDLAGVREIFRAMRGPNVRHVDASQSAEQVHSQLLDALVQGPLKERRCARSPGCADVATCSFRLAGACDWYRIARALGRDPLGGS